MKKTLLIVAVAGLAMASCKKDYTCECTSTSTAGSTTFTSVTSIKAKTSKKDAQAWCDAVPKASTTVNGTAATGGTPPTCTVK